MSNEVELRIPVGARVGLGEHRVLTCIVEATLEVASEDQAPVVARCTGFENEHEMRAWKGGLVGARMTRNGFEELQELQAVDWSKATAGEWNRMGSYPLWGFGGRTTRETTHVVAKASEHSDLEATVRKVQDAVSRSVVVGGQLYVPTAGPLLSMDRLDALSAQMMIVPPTYAGPFGDGRVGPWTAFDIDSIRELAEPMLEIEGTGLLDVSVLSWEGWGVERIRAQADEAVLNRMLGEMEHRIKGTDRLNAMSEDMVTALVELRDAIRGKSRGERIAVAQRYLEAARTQWGKGVESRIDVAMHEIGLALMQGRNELHAPELEGFSL